MWCPDSLTSPTAPSQDRLLSPDRPKFRARTRELMHGRMRPTEPDEQKMLDAVPTPHREMDDPDVRTRRLALESAVNL